MEPRPEQLQLYALLLGTPEPGSLEVLAAQATEHPWLAGPLAELQRLPLEHWQGEHTALFVSCYPRTLAPPFISALRHGQMGGGIEEELLAFYRRLGLEPEEMPADYLGTLFECAAWLLSQGEKRLPELRELWQEYLRPILPEFAQRLAERASLQLYLALGAELSRLPHLATVGMQATA